MRLPPSPAEWEAMKTEKAKLKVEVERLQEQARQALHVEDGSENTIQRLRADPQGAREDAQRLYLRAEESRLSKVNFTDRFCKAINARCSCGETNPGGCPWCGLYQEVTGTKEQFVSTVGRPCCTKAYASGYDAGKAHRP